MKAWQPFTGTRAALAVVACGLILACGQKPEPAAAGPAAAFAQVAAVEGGATMVETGAALAIGDRVAVGQTVKTGADGQVELAFAGLARIMVKANTSFRVDSLDAAGRRLQASDLGGTIMAKVEKLRSGDSLLVRTPASACGVRGTVFLVEVGAAGSRYAVKEGRVALLPAAAVDHGWIVSSTGPDNRLDIDRFPQLSSGQSLAVPAADPALGDLNRRLAASPSPDLQAPDAAALPWIKAKPTAIDAADSAQLGAWAAAADGSAVGAAVEGAASGTAAASPAQVDASPAAGASPAGSPKPAASAKPTASPAKAATALATPKAPPSREPDPEAEADAEDDGGDAEPSAAPGAATFAFVERAPAAVPVNRDFRWNVASGVEGERAAAEPVQPMDANDYELKVGEGARATLAVKDNGAAVAVEPGGAKDPAAVSLNARARVAVERGGIYQLSFTAWADKPAPLAAVIREDNRDLNKDGNPRTNYNPAVNVGLANRPQRFRTVFLDTAGDDPKALLLFQVGAVADTYHIQDVELVRLGSLGTPADGNLLPNGDFSRGFLGWRYIYSGGSHSGVGVEKGIFKYNPPLIVKGARGVQLESCQTVALQKGKTYQIEFDARSDRRRMLPCAIKTSKGGAEGGVASPAAASAFNAPLAGKWRHFKTTFTALAADRNAVVAFTLGAFRRNVYIDNVSLRAVD